MLAGMNSPEATASVCARGKRGKIASEMAIFYTIGSQLCTVAEKETGLLSQRLTAAGPAGRSG